jgi:hypothetical protein
MPLGTGTGRPAAEKAVARAAANALPEARTEAGLLEPPAADGMKTVNDTVMPEPTSRRRRDVAACTLVMFTAGPLNPRVAVTAALKAVCAGVVNELTVKPLSETLTLSRFEALPC